MKKIIFGIAVLAIAATVTLNVNLETKKSGEVPSLALANIEALADTEDPPTYDCPGGSTECVRVTRGNETHIFYKS